MNEAVELAVKALDSRKGLDIEILRVSDITVMADYFVICTGTSSTQIKTLANEVEFELKEKLDLDPLHREGYQGSDWILLDYGFLIVHVFLHNARDFYKLERLWSDGEHIDPATIIDQEGNNDEV